MVIVAAPAHRVFDVVRFPMFSCVVQPAGPRMIGPPRVSDTSSVGRSRVTDTVDVQKLAQVTVTFGRSDPVWRFSLVVESLD